MLKQMNNPGAHLNLQLPVEDFIYIDVSVSASSKVSTIGFKTIAKNKNVPFRFWNPPIYLLDYHQLC